MSDRLEWELLRVRTIADGGVYAMRQDDQEALQAVLAELARLQGWQEILAASEVRSREREERLAALETERDRLTTTLREVLAEFIDDDTDHWWAHGPVPGRDIRDWREVAGLPWAVDRAALAAGEPTDE